MNYYEHHIGDYDKATAHLTACEDGIYSRLLRRYYDTEAPLPLDLKALQRLVRARARDEKEAVETMLEEFFQKEADGWHHKRCDEEIARFQAKSEKARRSAEARWGKNATHSEGNADAYANADAEAMRTHSEGNAPRARPQTPVPKQEQKPSPASTLSPDPRAPAPTPTEAGLACRLMRQAGCTQTNPSHPDLLAALDEGVTPEALADTAAEGIAAGVAKPFAWAIQTARGRHRDGPRQLAQAPPATGRQQQQPQSRTLQAMQALDQVTAHAQSRVARLDPPGPEDGPAAAALPRP